MTEVSAGTHAPFSILYLHCCLGSGNYPDINSSFLPAIPAHLVMHAQYSSRRYRELNVYRGVGMGRVLTLFGESGKIQPDKFNRGSAFGELFQPCCRLAPNALESSDSVGDIQHHSWARQRQSANMTFLR